jgi:hypothetical protein
MYYLIEKWLLELMRKRLEKAVDGDFNRTISARLDAVIFLIESFHDKGRLDG